MDNQVILIGRIVNEIELKQNEDNVMFAKITLAIPRSFKNSDGIYEIDFIDFLAFGKILENTVEYYKVGDLIGVKGRLKSQINIKDDGSKEKEMTIIGEKVIFLSTVKNNI